LNFRNQQENSARFHGDRQLSRNDFIDLVQFLAVFGFSTISTELCRPAPRLFFAHNFLWRQQRMSIQVAVFGFQRSSRQVPHPPARFF